MYFRFFFAVLLDSCVEGLVHDIPVQLRHSRHGPWVVGASSASSGSSRFYLDTTRIQSVVLSSEQDSVQIDVRTHDGEGGVLRVPIPRLDAYSIEPIDINAELIDRVAGGFGSDLGNAVGSMMLIPPSSYTSFWNGAGIRPPSSSSYSTLMVLNPANASAYCFEGTMGYAFGRGIGESDMGIFTLKVGMSVIGHNGEPQVGNVANEATDGLYHGYYIDTTAEFDRIPEAVMFEWEMAVQEAGLHVNFLPGTNVQYTEYSLNREECESTRHLFPSFMYTILVGDGPHDTSIAARIVLNPEDYMPSTPNGRCVVQLVGDGSASGFSHIYKLGMNFIQRAALLFDYENSRLGIGEPL